MPSNVPFRPHTAIVGRPIGVTCSTTLHSGMLAGFARLPMHCHIRRGRGFKRQLRLAMFDDVVNWDSRCECFMLQKHGVQPPPHVAPPTQMGPRTPESTRMCVPFNPAIHDMLAPADIVSGVHVASPGFVQTAMFALGLYGVAPVMDNRLTPIRVQNILGTGRIPRVVHESLDESVLARAVGTPFAAHVPY